MHHNGIECDACGKPIVPPPEFILPPPPLPPTITTDSLPNCKEPETAAQMQQVWYNEMCEAMPIFDDSFYRSQSLQISVVVAFFCLLFILGVIVSSLFAWKNKCKMQNMLSCKTPTRAACITSNLPLTNGCVGMYEDVEAHTAFRKPLNTQSFNMLCRSTVQSIHYPSGYPMTSSPPFLDSSSPGPDPYRSQENIYEELYTAQCSDIESEPPPHSDDDFAEDELSLVGDPLHRPEAITFHSTVAAALRSPAADLHDKLSQTANETGKQTVPQSTVLSPVATTRSTTSISAAIASSSYNGSSRRNNSADMRGKQNSGGGLFSTMLRHATRHSKLHPAHKARTRVKHKCTNSADNLDNVLCARELNYALWPQPSTHTSREVLSSFALSLRRQQSQSQSQSQPQSQPLPLPEMPESGERNRNCLGHIRQDVRGRTMYTEHVVSPPLERDNWRRRVNYEQAVSNKPGTLSGVSTICAQLQRYPRTAMDQWSSHGIQLNPNRRVRTVYTPYRAPKSMEPISPPAYDCLESIPQAKDSSCEINSSLHNAHSEGISNNKQQQQSVTLATSLTYHNCAQLYSPADSSFGSDSGYSQHTIISSSTGAQDTEQLQFRSVIVEAPNKFNTTPNPRWRFGNYEAESTRDCERNASATTTSNGAQSHDSSPTHLTAKA